MSITARDTISDPALDVGIAVMAYSRPQHFLRLVSSLKQLNINRFSVYIDGADDHLIREQQKEIHSTIQSIDWADVNVVQRPINMGLRRSIVSAVTEELSKHEAVILLEDDCIPLPGFFDFMLKGLSNFRGMPKVRSLCGYQFPHVANYTAPVTPICVSRFVPWGWATWRDRWNEYELDLNFIIERLNGNGIYDSLPKDVISYIDDKSGSRQDANDIWSVNWVLVHHLTNSYCVFPSRPLVHNIGFDGTGVHCLETNAFNLTEEHTEHAPTVDFGDDLHFDQYKDKLISDYMERHWGKTMNLSSPNLESADPVSSSNVDQVVATALRDCKIVDIHTHLFPEQHSEFFLSGFDDLLTYHYLTVEALRVSEFDPSKFFSMKKSSQAEFVWNTLFRERIPLSEAAHGIVTTLNFFGIEATNRSYSEVREIFDATRMKPDQLLDKLGIERVVMTNDPFNNKEWALFEMNNWDRSVYRAALRMDTLFTNTEQAIEGLRQFGILRSDETTITPLKLRAFLDAVNDQAAPVYVAISADGTDLKRISEDPLMTEGLIPWLSERGIPLALMVGVKRGVNPAYYLGGDGLGDPGLITIERLARYYPELHILVTHLHESSQHDIIVLARKFPNLKLFGFWWFMNQPSLIRQNLSTRLDLLGSAFIPQHSDARVLEQLIYKWIHFKSLLQDELTERYRKLILSGWALDRTTIKRDVQRLMADNAKEIIR